MRIRMMRSDCTIVPLVSKEGATRCGWAIVRAHGHLVSSARREGEPTWPNDL